MKHFYQYYRVFSFKGSGGNGACVFVDQNYTDEEMQLYARMIGLSEIAFVRQSADGYYMRFFTPNKEIEMCGHATLAVAMFIRDYFHEAPDQILAGEHRISIKHEGETVLINLGEAEKIKEVAIEQELADTLAINTDDIGYEKMKPVIYKSGIPDILLPVRDYKTLMNLKLDRDKMIKISQSYKVVGIHAFTMQEQQIYARNFAPLYNIDEEYATGTSNNSLIAYFISEGYSLSSIGSIIQGDGNQQGQIFYKIDQGIIYVGGQVISEDVTYEID